VAVQVILLKTAKEQQKQVGKVASTAGGTSKTILNAHQKLEKKGGKTVTVIVTAR
jgi:hypothetical protein